jgi:hypothetical protein
VKPGGGVTWLPVAWDAPAEGLVVLGVELAAVVVAVLVAVLVGPALGAVDPGLAGPVA